MCYLQGLKYINKTENLIHNKKKDLNNKIEELTQAMETFISKIE